MLTGIARKATQDAAGLLDKVWRKQTFELPVDPIAIATELGFDVYRTSMKPGAAGHLRVRPANEEDPARDFIKEIFTNAHDTENRQRFSCAHELGHYMKAVIDGEAAKAHTEWRDERAASGRDPKERYANSFAAELLMPEREVRARRGTHPAQLAWIFAVSEEAMVNRLKNLDLL